MQHPVIAAGIDVVLVKYRNGMDNITQLVIPVPECRALESTIPADEVDLAFIQLRFLGCRQIIIPKGNTGRPVVGSDLPARIPVPALQLPLGRPYIGVADHRTAARIDPVGFDIPGPVIRFIAGLKNNRLGADLLAVDRYRGPGADTGLDVLHEQQQGTGQFFGITRT